MLDRKFRTKREAELQFYVIHFFTFLYNRKVDKNFLYWMVVSINTFPTKIFLFVTYKDVLFEYFKFIKNY